jgi:hypothetical protein
MTKMKNFLVYFAVMALLVMGFPLHRANAAITSVSWSGTNITGSSIAISTELGNTGDSTINYTTAGALTADGNILYFVLNGAVVTAGQTLTVADLTIAGLTLEAAPGTADNGAAEVTITNGASGNSNPTIQVVLDSNTGTPPNYTAGAKTLVIADGQLESSATPGNYNIVVMTSAEVGLGMLYVGDDNDVLVTAMVTPTLSFIIRNTGDTADTNECPLGILTTSSVATCSYRLAVATNASGGFQVQINSDGGLNSGANDINAIAEDSTVTAGTEGYGIAVTGATSGGNNSSDVYNQPVVENGDFNDDDTPVPVGATNFISFGNTFIYTPSVLAESTLVTHRAAISAGTPAGLYDQVVTYTVTATF